MSQYKILCCDSGLITLGARLGVLGAQVGAGCAAGCAGGALGRAGSWGARPIGARARAGVWA